MKIYLIKIFKASTNPKINFSYNASLKRFYRIGLLLFLHILLESLLAFLKTTVYFPRRKVLEKTTP